jgi:hypothetical protein
MEVLELPAVGLELPAAGLKAPAVVRGAPVVALEVPAVELGNQAAVRELMENKKAHAQQVTLLRAQLEQAKAQAELANEGKLLCEG